MTSRGPVYDRTSCFLKYLRASSPLPMVHHLVAAGLSVHAQATTSGSRHCHRQARSDVLGLSAQDVVYLVFHRAVILPAMWRVAVRWRCERELERVGGVCVCGGGSRAKLAELVQDLVAAQGALRPSPMAQRAAGGRGNAIFFAQPAGTEVIRARVLPPSAADLGEDVVHRRPGPGPLPRAAQDLGEDVVPRS